MTSSRSPRGSGRDREKKRAVNKKYERTAKGCARKRRYERSAKGKASTRRYALSAKARAMRWRYESSKKGRANQRRYRQKFTTRALTAMRSVSYRRRRKLEGRKV